MNWRAMILGALMVFAAPLQAAGAEPELAPLLSGELDVVTHWDVVPEAVRHALAQRWHTAQIAEPGAPFQVTDVIMPGQELPVRRLVFAAKSAQYWFVCYERGGIAHVFQLSVLPFAAGRVDAAKVRTVMLQRPAQDLDALRALLRAHGYRDTDFE